MEKYEFPPSTIRRGEAVVWTVGIGRNEDEGWFDHEHVVIIDAHQMLSTVTPYGNNMVYTNPTSRLCPNGKYQYITTVSYSGPWDRIEYHVRVTWW